MIEAWYRRLLRFYPRAFRERFGTEVLETARELDRRGGGPRRRLGALLDALRTAPSLHAEYRAERRLTLGGDKTVPAERILRDIRFALRGVRREPAFAAFVIATLALAIGANAALFGIADRLLLSGPAHVADADLVARVYVTVHPPGLRQFTSSTVGHVTYDIVRQRVPSAESVGSYAVNEGTTGRGAAARSTRVGFASAGFFPLLGVRPALGRFFSEDEDSVGGAQRVVVISDGIWRREFGAAQDAVGRALVVNDETFVVLGVAPAGFTGAELSPVELWVPINLFGPRVTEGWTHSWSAQWLAVVMRLRPGVSRDAAERELTAAFRMAYTGDEPYMREARVWLADLSADEQGTEPAESSVMRWLSGVALVVLLIACANVMNLLLARGARRVREVGVRMALGASRAALVRMLVIESMALSVTGAAAGLAVAHAVASLARQTLLESIEWTTNPVNGRVMAVSAAAAVLIGAVVGVIPALGITKDAIARALRSGIRDGGGHRLRLRAGLTVFQSTLSVALLIGAGLFVRSVSNARHVDLGFDADQVLVVEVSRSSLARMEPAAREVERARRQVFLSSILEPVRLIPGIEHASVAVGLPFGNRFSVRVAVPGMDALPQVPTGGPSISAIEPAYFKTMGSRVVRGREFSAGDRAGSPPVAIVSEFMARTVWPDADPIGRCVLVGQPPGACATIVGIAQNTHRGRLVEAPKMHLYIPLGQEVGFGGAVLLVRASDKPTVHAEAIRQTLLEADSTITFVTAETLQQRIDPQMRSWQLGTTTLMFSGLLALIVAAVGIYSVLSYLVADRRHEIGVRMALGARADHVAGMVLRWSLGMASLGVIIGSALAAAAATFIQPLLFQVSARDPLVFSAVSGILLLVAAAASLAPGLRAARVDPLEALRAE